MNILQLGSIAYSHYLDVFAVPCITNIVFLGSERIEALLSDHFTLPGIKPNSTYFQLFGGQMGAGRELSS